MAAARSAAAAAALLALCLIAGTADATYKLQERYNWNQLDFAFPSQTIKDQAIASGDYIPTNGLPVGVEHWGNKLFVTVPRWRDGESIADTRWQLAISRFPAQVLCSPSPRIGSSR